MHIFVKYKVFNLSLLKSQNTFYFCLDYCHFARELIRYRTKVVILRLRTSSINIEITNQQKNARVSLYLKVVGDPNHSIVSYLRQN